MLVCAEINKQAVVNSASIAKNVLYRNLSLYWLYFKLECVRDYAICIKNGF